MSSVDEGMNLEELAETMQSFSQDIIELSTAKSNLSDFKIVSHSALVLTDPNSFS